LQSVTFSEPTRRPALRWIALATFLTLVPITLLVPGLTELVVDRHGGTRFQAHLFVSLNQLAGIIAVPFAIALHRKYRATHTWILVLLLVDAVAFLGMRSAPNLTALFAWRALDGMAHLPAVTFLMIAANRAGGQRRGASMGVVASALMVGVGVGAPLGGILIDRSPMLVYAVGAALLVIAALTATRIPATDEGAPLASGRYHWDRKKLVSWMPLAYGFADRFLIGVFVSTFTLYLTEVHGVSAAARGTLMSLFLLPFAALCWPAGTLADRAGWFAPLIGANVMFGVVYASYGVVPFSWLPVLMVLSGVLSALMFAPSLVLVSEFAKRGAGEGLFGAFQIAGSIGFLMGPIVGGLLVESLRAPAGGPWWAAIFASVGIALSVFGLLSARVLAPHARKEVAEAGRHGGRANVPIISPSVPTRGTKRTRAFGAWMLKLLGWKFSGELFPDAKKMVIIVAPHTSNWDFVVGVFAMYAVGIRVTFLGKDTLFKFPLGLVMRFLGGLPVDRASKSDVVTQTVELVQKSERIIIALAPEGTRRAVLNWRTGFWWIASRAKVPVLPIGLDFKAKEVRVFPTFTTTGSVERDVALLRSLFKSEMAFDPAKHIEQ
jgi:1-acyl-sn-glycerol-3-phosphate acyltransferase